MSVAQYELDILPSTSSSPPSQIVTTTTSKAIPIVPSDTRSSSTQDHRSQLRPGRTLSTSNPSPHTILPPPSPLPTAVDLEAQIPALEVLQTPTTIRQALMGRMRRVQWRLVGGAIVAIFTIMGAMMALKAGLKS